MFKAVVLVLTAVQKFFFVCVWGDFNIVNNENSVFALPLFCYETPCMQRGGNLKFCFW